MSNKSVWITESSSEEKGPFCDTRSGAHYEHGNLTDVVQEETRAIEAGEEVVFIDAPYLNHDTYDVTPGQEFNIYHTETDGQGGLSPRRHGPGY